MRIIFREILKDSFFNFVSLLALAFLAVGGIHLVWGVEVWRGAESIVLWLVGCGAAVASVHIGKENWGFFFPMSRTRLAFFLWVANSVPPILFWIVFGSILHLSVGLSSDKFQLSVLLTLTMSSFLTLFPVRRVDQKPVVSFAKFMVIYVIFLLAGYLSWIHCFWWALALLLALIVGILYSSFRELRIPKITLKKYLASTSGVALIIFISFFFWVREVANKYPLDSSAVSVLLGLGKSISVDIQPERLRAIYESKKFGYHPAFMRNLIHSRTYVTKDSLLERMETCQNQICWAGLLNFAQFVLPAEKSEEFFHEFVSGCDLKRNPNRLPVCRKFYGKDEEARAQRPGGFEDYFTSLMKHVFSSSERLQGWLESEDVNKRIIGLRAILTQKQLLKNIEYKLPTSDQDAQAQELIKAIELRRAKSDAEIKKECSGQETLLCSYLKQ